MAPRPHVSFTEGDTMSQEPKLHCMLDLETLGTAPGSIILEVGAVAFDPYGPLLGAVELLSEKVLYRPVDIQSCLNLGMTLSASTLVWWLKQTESNRERITTMPKTSITVIADGLRQFLQKYQVTHIWSHGSCFDIPLMEWVYTRIKKEIPWHHKTIRDTRTLFDVAEFTEEKWKQLSHNPQPHHPACDAWTQARLVQYCLNGDLDDEQDTTVSGHDDPAGARIIAG